MSHSVTVVQVASAAGVALGEMKKAEGQANLLREAINKYIAQLYAAKTKLGTYRKDGSGCETCTAFVDGGVSAGLKLSTMQQTYLPTFKKAVESGKPVTDWNGQRAKGKKGKGAKASEPKSLANKLATCYRDAEFAGFIADLQTAYDNDEGDLLDCIKSYLEAEGIELKDAE